MSPPTLKVPLMIGSERIASLIVVPITESGRYPTPFKSREITYRSSSVLLAPAYSPLLHWVTFFEKGAPMMGPQLVGTLMSPP